MTGLCCSCTEDEELVMNCLETIVNLAPFLYIKLFEDSTKGQITYVYS